MSAQFPHLAARLIGVPLLVEPMGLQAVLSVLSDQLALDRIDLDGQTIAAPEARALAQGTVRAPREYAVEDGIATIPVRGSLVSRSSSLRPMSGMTGYSAITAALESALADDEVRGILLDIDSPGGEVSGCFPLCQFIREVAHQKPIWAIVDEMAASAAYAIACAAERIYAPRSAVVGSIGALIVHRENSVELGQLGRKVTIIQAGKRKSDGNPYEPLPPEARASFQYRLDDLRAQFAELVAHNREIDVEKVLSTEANVLLAADAQHIGLIDEVLSPRQVRALFRRERLGLNDAQPSTEETLLPTEDTSMTASTFRPAAAAAATLDHAAIRREIAARHNAIMSLPAAQGSLASLASHLAAESDMTVEQVDAALAAVKTTSVADNRDKAALDFVSYMATVANPQIGPDNMGDSDPEVEALVRRARLRDGRG